MRSNAALHYLDNAATTMVDPAVADAIHTALLNQWANPSSLYEPAVLAQMALGSARGKVAATLGCTAKELYFTSGGTEGNNLAILGAVAPRRSWGDTIIVSGFEHPSVQKPIRALGKAGMRVVEVNPGPDGRLAVDELVAAVDSRTALCCCMAVNNETGARQDIARLAAGVKAKNNRTAVHVDAVQAWLRMRINLKAWPGVDSLVVSGHKVHAPKGIGALYLRAGYHWTPPILGGGQENGVRPGTENTPYAIGLAAAAEAGARTLSAHNAAIRALNARLRAGLASIPGVTINSPDDAVPEVLNFSQHAVRSQTMLNFLSDRQIYVSSGSACDKGEPSHTLAAMGCDADTIDTALRVSFCADNTAEDVDALLEGLRAGLAELQHSTSGRRLTR